MSDYNLFFWRGMKASLRGRVWRHCLGVARDLSREITLAGEKVKLADPKRQVDNLFGPKNARSNEKVISCETEIPMERRRRTWRNRKSAQESPLWSLTADIRWKIRWYDLPSSPKYSPKLQLHSLCTSFDSLGRQTSSNPLYVMITTASCLEEVHGRVTKEESHMEVTAVWSRPQLSPSILCGTLWTP